MDGSSGEYLCFLWGRVGVDDVIAVLEAHRSFGALGGPVGPFVLVAVRDRVLIDMRRENSEALMVRCIDVDRPGQAWITAHALFWLITRHPEIEEAILIGPDPERLHYGGGRFLPAVTPSDD